MSDVPQPGEQLEQQSAPQASSIEGLERPATVFLSYAHEDTEIVIDLQMRLNMRGVFCLRDKNFLLSGSDFEREIEHAIQHEADAIVLYLTPHCLTSDFIWKVEIASALRRRERDPHFHIMPILHGVTLTEIQQCGFNYGLKKNDLSRFHAISINYDEISSSSEEAQHMKRNDVARRLLQAALTLRLRRIKADRNYEPWICLKTFGWNPPAAHLDLNLDWFPLFLGKERIPTLLEWKHILLPALRDVTQCFSEKASSHRLHVYMKSILPAATALGFAFRKPTGLTLLLEGEREKGTWSTDALPSEIDPLHIEWIKTSKRRQSEAVVAVDTAKGRSIKQAVVNALPALNLKPGYHVHLSLPGASNEGVRDAAHAQAIAQQVGRVCQELSDQRGVTHIHLFLPGPVELAVLIGQQLNALCPVTLYEYGAGNSYKPVCTLVSH